MIITFCNICYLSFDIDSIGTIVTVIVNIYIVRIYGCMVVFIMDSNLFVTAITFSLS